MVGRDMIRREVGGRLTFGAMLAMACASLANAQSCELPGGQKLESERYLLTFKTKPERVRIGEHFAMEMMICPKAGQAAPEGVRVDGFMPDHNHGMNYKAVVKPAGAGRFEAAGMMFHMPGKWDFIFEVRGAGKTDRMTHSVMLQ
jgi:hypothetical protein